LATVCKTVRPMLSDRCPVCPVLSVTLLYCGQTVGRIEVKHGMLVGLGPRHIVLHGNPAPPRKGAQQHPTFEIYGHRLCLCPYNPRSMSIVPNGWMDQDETWHGRRPRPSPNCVKWGSSSPNPKGHSRQFAAMSVFVKRLDGSRCHLVRR